MTNELCLYCLSVINIVQIEYSALFILGFGAAASIDDSSSRQNGFPKNKVLREAHQTLDNNLGKSQPASVDQLFFCFFFLFFYQFPFSLCLWYPNLDEMADGLKRLKNLGLGLQSEIDDQDVSIDSLVNKVDKMDLKIHNTNQQLKKL